ncbi:glycosyltransferase family 4 protein [Trichothermofontia sp.]
MTYRITLLQAISNSCSLNAAIALSEAGWLHEVVTTLAYDPQGRIARCLDQLPAWIGQPIAKELGRRTWSVPGSGKIRSHIFPEALRVLICRSGLHHALRLNAQALVDRVFFNLDLHASRYHLNDIDAVYAYEDEASSTFVRSKERGILCLYDLAIPFYKSARAIQAEEAERFPELASAIQAIQEPTWKLERKEQEVKLADHFFVASSMTQRSLLDIGISPAKITIIPFGAPVDYFQPQMKPDQTFRVIYAGRLSPRKGVHYLLQAWKDLKLRDAELLMVGTNQMPVDWFAAHQNHFRHIASIPHALLNQYYTTANVLVFPSLVEGFGLVLTEAMACGIPVITTPNTAGPDILTDGQEGFIIPIRDVEALKEKLEWCYEHPKELAEMGQAARRKAETMHWGVYRRQLITSIRTIMESNRRHHE